VRAAHRTTDKRKGEKRPPEALPQRHDRSGSEGSSLVLLKKRNLALGERSSTGYCLSIRGHENLSPVGANRERTSAAADKSRGGIEEAERLSAMWYFYAAVGPTIWALLNHLDKYLLGRFFMRGATGAALAFFTGFAGVLVACGILLFDLSRAAALEPGQALLVMAAGAFLVASYIPYLVALESAEASVIASLFRLLPFFVFAIAYVVLGETLRTTQIVGGLLASAGAALLTLDFREDTRRLRVRSLLLMCAACALNACGAVIFKFVALARAPGCAVPPRCGLAPSRHTGECCARKGRCPSAPQL
jgi:uncharacterized membrane protein